MQLFEKHALANFFSFLKLRKATSFYFYYERSYTGLAEIIHQQAPKFGLELITLEITADSVHSLINTFSQQVNYVFAYDILQREIPLSDSLNLLRTELKKNANHNLIMLVNINSHFNEIFSAPYNTVCSLNKSIIQQAKLSKMMYVTDSNGSFLNIELDKNCWDNIDGSPITRDFIPSEVANGPLNVNGELYFTGGFLSQIPLASKYGLINEPIRFIIKNCQIIHVQTENLELKNDLDCILAKNAGNSLVAEAGIGTNPGVKLLGLGLPFEERHCGFHLGIGGKLPNSLHWDLIFSDSKISFDDKLIFESNAGFFL